MSCRAASEIPRTKATVAVVRFFLEDPEAEHYATEITKLLDSANGTIIPLLSRLLEAGWLSERWEEGNKAELQRPLRRYFRLTANGRREAEAYLRLHGLSSEVPAAEVNVEAQVAKLKLNLNTGWVLQAFSRAPETPRQSRPLAEELKMSSREAQGILHRLRAIGWLTADNHPGQAVQGSRLSYRLTPIGQQGAVIYLGRFPRP
jgi:DNA-binding PadR family transcriptional regulator